MQCINYRMYKSDRSLEFYPTFRHIKKEPFVVVLCADITNYLEKLAFIKTSEYALNILSQKYVAVQRQHNNRQPS